MPPGEPSGLGEAQGVQTEEGSTGKLSLFKREVESLRTLTEDEGINKRVDEEAGVWPVGEALAGEPQEAKQATGGDTLDDNKPDDTKR